MEDNIVNTRFNDFTGTIAADIEAIHSNMGRLEEIAKMYNVDLDDLKPVGFHIYGSYGDIDTYLICKEVKTGKEISKLLSLNTENFLTLFKRIDVKLTYKGL